MFASALKKKLHFTATAQAQRSDHIFLVRGLDTTGQNAWYYVMADTGKRDAFRSKSGVALLKLTDFGTILYSGFGTNPPETIRRRMEDDYNFTSS